MKSVLTVLVSGVAVEHLDYPGGGHRHAVLKQQGQLPWGCLALGWEMSEEGVSEGLLHSGTLLGPARDPLQA